MTEQAAHSPQWYRGRESEKEEKGGKGGKESISNTSVFLSVVPRAQKEVLLCSFESLYRFYGQLVQFFYTIPLGPFLYLLSLLLCLFYVFSSFPHFLPFPIFISFYQQLTMSFTSLIIITSNPKESEVSSHNALPNSPVRKVLKNQCE